MRFLVILLWLSLAACQQSAEMEVETLELATTDFSISLFSEGELRAVESTPIMPPPGSRRPRTLRWLADNNTWVSQGQVVARFDIANAEREASNAGIEIDKVDTQVMAKQRELDLLLSELGNQLELVDIEKLMADQFVIDNTLAYSRHEIIDAMRNKELLDYRSGHLEDKKGTYSDRQGAEVAVLSAQRATQESKFDEHNSLLKNREVVAPHDGYFVIEKSWWGQKIDVGNTVFSGSKFASIPNLDKMEAVLNVLETEAVGINEGQKVNLRIDAFPEEPLTGTVSSISATASPIERDNPVKYFTVTVLLDQADPTWITPDAIVTAEILINSVPGAIAVPNQALFKDGEQDWVLVKDGGEFMRRDVQLGVRGANRSQVVDGLQAGEVIALFPPKGMST